MNDSQEEKQKTTTKTTTMTKLFSVVLTSAVAAVLIGGFAVAPSYGQASSTTSTTIRLPYPTGGVSICGGEETEINGYITYVFHQTVGPDGEFQYTVDKVILHGRGVDESGDKVVLAQAGGGVDFLRQTSDEEFDLQVHGTLVTQGSGINTLIEILIHMTIDPNGEVTATIEHVDLKCGD